MTKESNILKDIMLAAGKAGVTLFRNNTAMAWVGIPARTNEPRMMMVLPGDILLRQARPLHAGLVRGSSDLIGWHKHTGKFTAIETKTDVGRVSVEQKNFLEQVNSSNGISGVCRSVSEFLELIHQSTDPLP